MGYRRSKKAADRETKILKAIAAFKNKEFMPVFSPAAHFEVNKDTLSRRLTGGKSQAWACESTQILTVAEEKTLIWWTKSYSIG